MSADDDVQKIIEFNENEAPPSDNEEEIENNDFEQYDEEEDEIEEPIGVDDSIAQLTEHTDDVLRVCVSESTRWLASGSKDNSVFVWDLDNAEGNFFINSNIIQFSKMGKNFLILTKFSFSFNYLYVNFGP